MPSARTGNSQVPQVMPAMPASLLVMAPNTPITRVPCQELLALGQSAAGNTAVFC